MLSKASTVPAGQYTCVVIYPGYAVIGDLEIQNNTKYNFTPPGGKMSHGSYICGQDGVIEWTSGFLKDDGWIGKFDGKYIHLGNPEAWPVNYRGGHPVVCELKSAR